MNAAAGYLSVDDASQARRINHKGSKTSQKNILQVSDLMAHRSHKSQSITEEIEEPTLYSCYSTLLEEAEKLYNKSIKEWTEQIMTEYSIKNNSSQLFKPDKERRQQFYDKLSNRLSLPVAISNNQTYPFKRVEHIFVKNRILI